jgi:1-acyl-sn-glycerol-3-phosphate acyltransferase
MPVPPVWARRLLIAPLVVLGEALVLIASPLLLLVAALVSRSSAARPLRLALIVLVFVHRHFTALTACLVLWLAARSGREDHHYAVMGWFVSGVYRAVVRLAHVEVEFDDSTAGQAALSDGQRPVVVLSRHAGEGDTLLVLHLLLCLYHRRPRVVMHEALRLDPLIDVLGSRLPNRFVDPRGGDTEREIAAMSSTLGSRDAVVIFPEGGNVSDARRRRAVERLERAGHADEAALARSMAHVAAPRPGGALAAIEARPDADVVILGHVGLPTGFRELWRLLPHRQVVHVRLWAATAAEIPAGREEQIDWLFRGWRTLDQWVGERHQQASRAPQDDRHGRRDQQRAQPAESAEEEHEHESAT